MWYVMKVILEVSILRNISTSASLDDLRARLKKHNAGEVPHARNTGLGDQDLVAFSDEVQALAFERYLSASGRAFAKKRL